MNHFIQSFELIELIVCRRSTFEVKISFVEFDFHVENSIAEFRTDDVIAEIRFRISNEKRAVQLAFLQQSEDVKVGDRPVIVSETTRRSGSRRSGQVRRYFSFVGVDAKSGCVKAIGSLILSESS